MENLRASLSNSQFLNRNVYTNDREKDLIFAIKKISFSKSLKTSSSSLMQQKQRYYILTFGIVLCIFTFSVMLFNKKPAGFSLDKVRSPFEKSSKWAIGNLSAFEKEEIQDILSQGFNYLGSGAQCYAFLSSDGKYVIKFFRMKHLIPKKWLKLIPLPGLDKYRFSKIDKRMLRHQELFASYKMAYDELKEEAGLVYIHLNKSKDLRIRVKLYDRMRNCYVANLDEYEFVLQKKTQLVHNRITALMQRGKREEALESMHKLLRQVVVQCKKGFYFLMKLILNFALVVFFVMNF